MNNSTFVLFRDTDTEHIDGLTIESPNRKAAK